MQFENVVRVFGVKENSLEVFDDNRTFELMLQEMTSEQKERLSHIAEGTFLHVKRDYMGNVVGVVPFPMDDEFCKVREKEPKPEPENLVREGQKAWDIS